MRKGSKTRNVVQAAARVDDMAVYEDRRFGEEHEDDRLGLRSCTRIPETDTCAIA